MSETLNTHTQRSFIPWGEGSEISLLRKHNSGGVTMLTRFHRGATGQWHTHPNGEELYVVSGRLRVGTRDLSAGDYLYTPPGAGHDVYAFEEALLLLVLPELPDYSASRET